MPAALGLFEALAAALLVLGLGELGLAEASVGAGDAAVLLVFGREDGVVRLGEQRVERPLEELLLDGGDVIALGPGVLVDRLEQVLPRPHHQVRGRSALPPG